MMPTLKMLSLALALPTMAAEIPSEVTLFKNVNICDGENEKLLSPENAPAVKAGKQPRQYDQPTGARRCDQ
jgi:hypothetical protein